MGRTCYLCGQREIKGEKTVAMHKFPKDAALLSAWYKFCGLCEGVDIVTGSVVICGRHFESADYIKPDANLFGGRLRPGAVPSILKPKRSVAVNESISKEDILPLTIVDHVTSCNFNVDIESECNVKRRYAKPRFISEIELTDLATLKQARHVLALVRKTDEKKSKRIRKLQFENRYLRKRINTLKESVVQLRQKGLTAKEAGDTSMTLSETLPVEVVSIKEEIIEDEVIIIKKESDEDEESCVLVSNYICDACGKQYSIKPYFEAHKKICNREFDENNADGVSDDKSFFKGGCCIGQTSSATTHQSSSYRS